MTVEAAVRRDIGIRDIDFTAILGNALENAVNGCMEAEEETPFIHVVIHTKNNKLVIVVKNTCHGRVVFENGIPQSKKSGIGVRSMIRSAANYDGQLGLHGGILTSRKGQMPVTGSLTAGRTHKSR